MKGSTSILGLIIARAGSKGVPNKNMRLLGGKPLLAHTLAPPTESSVLDRVIISTDSPAMADLAKEHGVEVPFMRPTDLASDSATSQDVLLHALDHLEEHDGYAPDALMLLQPTSPFRTVEDIAACAELYGQRNPDGVVSLTSSHAHPYGMKRVSEEGVVAPFFPEADMTANRQQWPQAYTLNGAVFLRKTSIYRGWRQAQQREDYPEGKIVLPYVMPPERSIEIDEEIDFLLAEALVAKQQGNGLVSQRTGA
jgi:CMP-N,N'-diacetyllegionaminic acid synthase